MVSSSTTAPSVLICHCPATRGAGQTVVATATSFGWNVAGLPRTDHSPAPGWDGRVVASFLHRKQAIQLSTKGLIQFMPNTEDYRLPCPCPVASGGPAGVRLKTPGLSEQAGVGTNGWLAMLRFWSTRSFQNLPWTRLGCSQDLVLASPTLMCRSPAACRKAKPADQHQLG